MIFYLHIPKTGGLTLGWRLASAFLPNQTHVLQNGLVFPKDVKTLRMLTQTKLFVESHVGGALLKDFNNLELMVTVRDPVERILSHWRHALREPTIRLHRAANKLHYREFFDRFGDYFVDSQAKYFTGAFIDISMEAEKFGHYATVTKRLLEYIGRVRWTVPTEDIDEFIGLWSLEAKRWVPNGTRRINVSENLPGNRSEILAEMRDYLRRRTDLYAVDSLFYNMARERFAAYRNNIALSQGIERYSGNSRQAFSSGESAIWLSENWYDPVPIDGGHGWWAGPTRKSVVHVRRASDEKYLTFDIIVISGIPYESVLVFDKSVAKMLPTRRVRSDSHCSFCVTLDGVGCEDDVVVLVPNCKAAIMTTEDSDGVDRQSFAATKWSLRNDAI